MADEAEIASELAREMYADVTLGIIVRSRMDQVMRDELAKWESENPGNFGHVFWRRKDGGGTPFGSFCLTVMEEAGGIDRFLAEWELKVTPGGKKSG